MVNHCILKKRNRLLELEENEEQMPSMITPLNMNPMMYDPMMMSYAMTYHPANFYHPMHPLNPMNIYGMLNPGFQGPMGMPGVPIMDNELIDLDEVKREKINSNRNLVVDSKIMDGNLREISDDSQDELNENLYDLEKNSLF